MENILDEKPLPKTASGCEDGIEEIQDIIYDIMAIINNENENEENIEKAKQDLQTCQDRIDSILDVIVELNERKKNE